MGRRSIENSRRRRYLRENRKNNHYFKSFILVIISIAIVIVLGLYLKNLKLIGTNKIENGIKLNGEIIGSVAKEIVDEHLIKMPIKKEILISFAGDFTLGTDDKFSYEGSLPAAFVSNGKNYSYFMKNVANIFNKDDYTLVNLETTLTNSNVKAAKDGEVYYNFKGPKEYAKILTSSSIEGVTIANNHIYDYGEEGIKDTISTLKENKVDICGEGYKIIKDIKGVKFGFLGYTGWEASDKLKTKIANDIKELRQQGAEVVIPYFHWGIERKYEPCDVQKNLARFSIDNGADAVIGSHPHVIQSIENYKGKLIAYSMGNFCFGGNANPPDKRTFVLQFKAHIQDDKLTNFEYKVIPAMISSRNDKNDYVPTLATGENRINILNTLNKLSPSLKGNISDEFFILN
ncbi:CapA family protein [Clostridium saccharoperbutylacetonicum]|uniref:CapA family protein n=1 Tax=Clostridium saccharoperbutylacetonicum TaxID=36745 RepID=UPI0039EB24F9